MYDAVYGSRCHVKHGFGISCRFSSSLAPGPGKANCWRSWLVKTGMPAGWKQHNVWKTWSKHSLRPAKREDEGMIRDDTPNMQAFGGFSPWVCLLWWKAGWPVIQHLMAANGLGILIYERQGDVTRKIDLHIAAQSEHVMWDVCTFSYVQPAQPFNANFPRKRMRAPKCQIRTAGLGRFLNNHYMQCCSPRCA